VPESAWLAISLLTSLVGMGWLALTIDAHWQQVSGLVPLSSSWRRSLRVLGAAALTLSLLMSFRADHPSMAPLVWIMELGVSALLVGLTLAFLPEALAMILPLRFRRHRP
jgi:hypothetical protein